MEFYILGVIALVVGMALKSLALRRRWVSEREDRRRRLGLIVLLTVAVPVYFLSIVVVLAIITLLGELGLDEQSAKDWGWITTLLLVVSLCVVMGWAIQFGHRAPPNFNPYADESPHPFGTDAPDTGLDFHADENAESNRP